MNKSMRITVGLLAASLAILTVTDAGLIAAAHMSVHDDATQAAYDAASAVTYKPVNLDSAEIAYAAAEKYAAGHHEHIVPGPANFILNPDGSVTLRLVKIAPTVGLNKIGFTKSWLSAEATATSKGVTGD